MEPKIRALHSGLTVTGSTSNRYWELREAHYQRWLMMQVGARQLFKKKYIYMLLTWRGTRIRLQSGLRRRVTLACSEWALVCRAEDQDFSAHTKHPDPCKPELACFGQALVLLQIETEQPEEILLQLCQLSIFKHSGPLKSCVSVGSPHLKDPQRAGHSQHEEKTHFLFTNFVKTEVTTAFSATVEFCVLR